MAHILQNIDPQYIPCFRHEIIEHDFDDVEIELLDIAEAWSLYDEKDAA